MRRKEKEISDPKELEEILRANTVCRLAFCRDNRPYLLPMNYGYEAGALYLHSAREGRKMDILAENPAVCFEISDSITLKTAEKACAFTSGFRSLIGTGEVEFLATPGEKRQGLQILMKQHSGRNDWDIPDKALAHLCVWKIPIAELTGKKSVPPGS